MQQKHARSLLPEQRLIKPVVWRLHALKAGSLPLILASVLLALLSSPAFSQQEALRSLMEAPADHPEKLAVHVDEVDLSFVVADKHHRWITDLTGSEIRLRDNGAPPESIRAFESQTGLPLRVGLLIDTSDSMNLDFAFEKDSAAMFISNMLDPAKDQAFVMGFNGKANLTQALTSNTAALAGAVKSLQLGGTTAVYDAISLACDSLVAEGSNSLTRRVLIVMTDGDDNSSRALPKETIEHALRSDVVVIVLYTAPEPFHPKYKILEKLANETGGVILRAGTKKDIGKAFSGLSAQLRSYYLLAYRPANFARNGSYHKIELKARRHGVRVICRKGYFASTSR